MSRQLSGSSEIKTEDGELQIKLDVNQFAPNEIEVKTVDNSIVIQAQHEEKMDEHGYISRQFTRRYVLPDGVKPETVQSSLSRDGILSITAPRPRAIETSKSNERVVPITMGSSVASPPPAAPAQPEPPAPAQ